VVDVLLDLKPHANPAFIEATFEYTNLEPSTLPFGQGNYKVLFVTSLLESATWEHRKVSFDYLINHRKPLVRPKLPRSRLALYSTHQLMLLQSLDTTAVLTYLCGYLYHNSTLTSAINSTSHNKTRSPFSVAPTIHTFTETHIQTLADFVFCEMSRRGANLKELSFHQSAINSYIQFLFACASQDKSLLSALARHLAHVPATQLPTKVHIFCGL